MEVCSYLLVSYSFKWLVSKTPYLIQQTTIAPHITGSRVFLIDNCFRSCPFDWHFASMRNIIAIILKVTGHSKVTYLRVRRRVIYLVCTCSHESDDVLQTALGFNYQSAVQVLVVSFHMLLRSVPCRCCS